MMGRRLASSREWKSLCRTSTLSVTIGFRVTLFTTTHPCSTSRGRQSPNAALIHAIGGFAGATLENIRNLVKARLPYQRYPSGREGSAR